MYRTDITYSQYDADRQMAVEHTYCHDSRRPLTYRGAQCLLTRIWHEAGTQAGTLDRPVVTRVSAQAIR